MLKIDYRNLMGKIDPKKYKKILDKIKQMPAPTFETTKPDLKDIVKKVSKYRKYKNVILIGNGGSRTSSYAFYNSLANFRNNVNFEFLTSLEPDTIKTIRKKYPKKETLVLVISKSGENINSIEPLLSLIDYPVAIVTGEKNNILREIARIKKWDIIPHPEVGGRYSGMTSCGLFPAALMDLDIKKIYAGAKLGYKKYNYKNDLEKNNALKLALYFFELEQKNYIEIFSGIYSSALFGFFPLIVQLIHESTGKNGKGQTIFGDVSPESQHHTNQRFFGGRKNVIGLFMGVEKSKNNFPINIPTKLGNLNFEKYPLKKLRGISAADTLHYDMQGVIENGVLKKIPAAALMVDEIELESIGEFMIFWQYFAAYSAYLRNQNPFDQPSVEDSKNISLKLRMTRKK